MTQVGFFASFFLKTNDERRSNGFNRLIYAALPPRNSRLIFKHACVSFPVRGALA